MPPIGMVEVSAPRRPRAEPDESGKTLKSIVIDLDDAEGASGGTVMCSYGSDGDVPFGGASKRKAFESRESMAAFVNEKLMGGSPAATPEPPADEPIAPEADVEADYDDEEE